MSPRPYRSAVRAAAGSETRSRIIEAARSVLLQGPAGSLTIDAVAAAAGVARMTVYHQFGSKRGLIEAVFDDLAARGGIGHLPEAFQEPDPLDGIGRLIAIFVRLWASQGDLVRRLRASAALDPDLERADRNQRRRQALGVLVARVGAGSGRDDAWAADRADVLQVLTSFDAYLTVGGGRAEADVVALLQAAAAALLAA